MNFIFASSGSPPARSVRAYNASYLLKLVWVKLCLSGFILLRDLSRLFHKSCLKWLLTKFGTLLQCLRVLIKCNLWLLFLGIHSPHVWAGPGDALLMHRMWQKRWDVMSKARVQKDSLDLHLRSSAHFSIELFVFLLLSCMSCLYIFEIKPLSVASLDLHWAKLAAILWAALWRDAHGKELRAASSPWGTKSCQQPCEWAGSLPRWTLRGLHPGWHLDCSLWEALSHAWVPGPLKLS